jgi:hypothetical protein
MSLGERKRAFVLETVAVLAAFFLDLLGSLAGRYAAYLVAWLKSLPVRASTKPVPRKSAPPTFCLRGALTLGTSGTLIAMPQAAMVATCQRTKEKFL